MSQFVHLHVHTQFSILDGAIKISAMVEKAKSDQMPAVAITDHGNMYGVKEYYNACKKAGLKPIIGCELYVARRHRSLTEKVEDRSGWHLVLLAKNRTGYNNLVKLVSLGWIEGFYYRPRIDWELLERYHEGLIASSACLAGEISRTVYNNSMDEASEIVERFKRVFGGDFYLELMRHETQLPGADKEVYERQQVVNEKLVMLARKHNVKLIATNDAHFVNAEDAEAHDRLICLTTNADINDPRRMRYTQQEWLKTTAEMQSIFSDLPEALENTMEIVGKIEEYDLNSPPIMPEFGIPEDFGTIDQYQQKYTEAQLRQEFTEERFDKLGDLDKVLRIKLEADYLQHLVYLGGEKRYGSPFSDEIKERIDFELNTIKTMGFPGYFLIVWDLLKAAREMGVWVGPGRGSAAGSVVAYALWITDIDPLKYGLLFERFLNPDRISLPDIDIDFDDEGRELVLKYVEEKYGHSRVANIITFGTMAAKSAIRDVARVQMLPLAEADYLAKLVPERPGTTLNDAFKEVPELQKARNSSRQDIASVLRYAETLEGSVRHTGVHACGVIIGKDDLIEYLPMGTSKDSSLLVTQIDGKHVEAMGMLKMDFLGLKTLTIIKDAVENVRLSRGIEIDINAIPLDDTKTYELYSRGETTGLFQFESEGMKKHLRDLKPTQFEDLIAMNALYRPGPMEYIPDFINRKHGREKIEYDFPIMEEVLKETYGITVYQEQVMQLSRIMAGFTRGQADSLRKAMGKKIQSMMEDLKPKFVEGCQEHHQLDEKKVLKVWNDWEAFAKYAFNKSHATCYSYVSYQTGWLKAHYPAEFMAAVLTNNLNDIKKITFFIEECKKQRIAVLGPDVNESSLKFTVNRNGEIRFGLGAIKGVGEGAVEAMLEERGKNGHFTDIFNLTKRLNLRLVNKRCLEALALAGAFDSFDHSHRGQYFYKEHVDDATFLEKVIKHAADVQVRENSMQQSLFGDAEEVRVVDPQLPDCVKWSRIEKLKREKEVTGFYLSGHPLDDYRVEVSHFCTKSIADLNDDLAGLNNCEVTFAGIVTSVSHRTTKNDKPFGTFTIEDYSDSIQLTLFSEDYLRFRHFIQEDGRVLLIRARAQKNKYRETDVPELKVQQISLMADLLENYSKDIVIHIPLDRLTEQLIKEMVVKMQEYKGGCRVKFLVGDHGTGRITMFPRDAGRKVTCSPFVRFLSENKLSFKLN